MTNQNILPFPTAQGAEPTMSSREIADLCEKNHTHVIRDIRTMLIELYGEEYVEKVIPEQYRNRRSEFIRENADSILNGIFAHFGDEPNWGHQKNRGFKWERDSRGYVTHFELDHNHTMTLVAGYKVKLRKAIIDRWQELESRAPAELTRMQLIMLAMDAEKDAIAQREKVATLEHQASVMAPKVEALGRLENSDGGHGVRLAAKMIDMTERKLTHWLQANRWAFRQGGIGPLQGYSEKRNQGYIEHRANTFYDHARGCDRTTAQMLITPKGLAKLAEIFAKEEV